MTNNLTSPYVTGGGGTVFEFLVGTFYLTSLLTNEIPRGLDWGLVKQVKFQQKYAGHYLDDIVIIATDGKNERKLSLHVKHDLKFTKSDDMFKTVLNDCWKIFSSNEETFNKTKDRLGICLGLYNNKVKRHFIPLTELAKNTTNADDFFYKINIGKFAAKERREYLKLVKSILEETQNSIISDHELWEFLKSLVILFFDFEHEGNTDINICLNKIHQSLRNPSINNVQGVLDRLYRLVSELSPNAGIIDLATLRTRLLPFNITDAKNINSDLNLLRSHSKHVLSTIRDKIGNKINFPRYEILDEIFYELEQNDVIIISGQSMVGKSVISKMVANNLYSEGECIFLSSDYFYGTSLESFLHNININLNFDALLSAIGGSPLRCIIIDGLDKAKDENKQRIVIDILNHVKKYNESLKKYGDNDNYKFRIIFTCREEHVESFIDILYLYEEIQKKKLKIIEINPLTINEINEVAKEFPKIQTLVEKNNLYEFLSRPYILDKITLAGINVPENIPEILSETWFLNWLWRDLVRRGNALRSNEFDPDSREQLLLEIASSVIEGEKGYQINKHTDTKVIAGLLSDRLIARYNGEIRFAHDSIENWSIVIWLERQKENLNSVLRKIGSKNVINEAFRLYCLKKVEIDEDPENWFNLVKELKELKKILPRWYQIALIAPISSTNIQKNLSLIESHIFAQNSQYLSDLLKLFRNKFLFYDPYVYTVFPDLTKDDFDKIAIYWTRPNSLQWIPLLKIMLQNKEVIENDTSFEFSFITEKWMEVNFDSVTLNIEIAEFCIEKAKKLLDDYKDEPKHRYINSILWAANVIPDKVNKFVKEFALRDIDKSNYGFEDLLLGRGWLPLCKYMPKTALELYQNILTEKIEPDQFNTYYQLFHDLGTVNTRWYPKSHFKGPFLGLLRMHEDIGIELINFLVNHATECWILREKNEWNRTPIGQIIKLKNEEIEVYGDELVYSWYKPMSVAPITIGIALMALEYWLKCEISNNRKPDELFNKVVKNTKSVAIIGVIISVAFSHIDKFIEIIIPIIENPAFWVMDIYKASHDLAYSKSTLSIYQIVPYILLNSSDKNFERLQSAIRDFPVNPPFLFEEEKEIKLNEIISSCKVWASYADIKNYEILQKKDYTVLRVKLPNELEDALKEEREIFNKKMRLMELQNWSLKLINEDIVEPQFNLDSAFKYAYDLSEHDNIEYKPHHFLEESEERARSISLFVAALTLRKWKWIEENNHSEWVKDQLLNATFRSEPPLRGHDNVSLFERGYKRSAARSLPFILHKHPWDTRIEKAIVKLADHNNYQVNVMLFDALKGLWNDHEKLLMQCIKIILKKSRKEKMDIYHSHKNIGILESLKYKIDLFNINNILNKYSMGDMNTKRMESIPFCIPRLDEINKSISIKVIYLIKQMMNFTFNCYNISQENGYNKWSYNSWNSIFFKILANTLLYLKDDSVTDDITASILEQWINTPDMLEEFLRQLIIIKWDAESEDRFTDLWLNIGNNVFDSINNKLIKSYYIEKICGLLIFTDPWQIEENKMSILVQNKDVLSLIDRWCEVVGFYPTIFSNLILFLRRYGFEIFPEKGIEWIYNCVTKVEDEIKFINQSRISSQLSELLYDVWNKKNILIQTSKEYDKFTYLVDRMVDVGEPLAFKIQEKIFSK